MMVRTMENPLFILVDSAATIAIGKINMMQGLEEAGREEDNNAFSV